MHRFFLILFVGTVLLLAGWSSTSKKPSEHVGWTVPTVVADTNRTSPIPIESCRKYGDFREKRKLTSGNVGSLHELTCRWAAQEELSINPRTLPSYIQTSTDSLQLDENMLAYGVGMRPLRDSSEGIYCPVYFVAETDDSLFHYEVQNFETKNRYRVQRSMRALRPIEVPAASAQYIWFEVGVTSIDQEDRSRGESWTGHILTYDAKQGVRYLSRTPVRSEVYKPNGELQSLYQLDVSVPEPGLMKIEKRTYKGKTRTVNWNTQIGLHVIDSVATDKRTWDGYRPSRYTRSYVVVVDSNADAWDRKSRYVRVVSPEEMRKHTSPSH